MSSHNYKTRKITEGGDKQSTGWSMDCMYTSVHSDGYSINGSNEYRFRQSRIRLNPAVPQLRPTERRSGEQRSALCAIRDLMESHLVIDSICVLLLRVASAK